MEMEPIRKHTFFINPITYYSLDSKYLLDFEKQSLGTNYSKEVNIFLSIRETKIYIIP